MKAFALWVLALVIGALFTNELLGLLSRLSRFLVECAVRRLPESMQHDRREEWLANLEYEGQDGKKLSELTAALEAWCGAGRTARALETRLPIEEQVKLLRTRSSRRFYLGIGISFLGQGVLSFAESLQPNIYQISEWAWPLFIAVMVIGFTSTFQLNRCYKRAEKLEAENEKTVQDNF